MLKGINVLIYNTLKEKQSCTINQSEDCNMLCFFTYAGDNTYYQIQIKRNPLSILNYNIANGSRNEVQHSSKLSVAQILCIFSYVM